MKRKFNRTQPQVLLYCTLLFCNPAVSLEFNIQLLGGINETSNSYYSSGLNNKGDVVGYEFERTSRTWQAVKYTTDGFIGLGTLGGSSSFSYGINDIGVIVGGSRNNQWDAGNEAFEYKNSQMNGLGTLGGTWSSARGINNSGAIVGFSKLFNTSFTHAFIYENGVMSDLGTLGGTESNAYAISDAGYVTGNSRVASGEIHAFIAHDGVMSDLGTIAGKISQGYDVNNLGAVVGDSTIDTATGDRHAFLYQNNNMIDLGTLGGRYSEALGINDNGWIVGNSDIALDPLDPFRPSSSHAFLFDGSDMLDLNNLIRDIGDITLMEAVGINESGQIAAWGNTSNGIRSFLLSPIVVPAPATLWLFGSGLIGLIGIARRKKI